MKNKKRVLLTTLVLLLTMTTIPFKSIAIEAADENPVIINPSFEDEVDETETQLYKAERTDEKAYDGSYSIKVGAVKPTDVADVPKWQYNLGKGGVNVLVSNVEPNTKYTIGVKVWNETGVRMQVGAVDIDAEGGNPWGIAVASSELRNVSSDWENITFSITTGPRTNDFYIFAYCMNEKTGADSGAFYIDNLQIEKSGVVAPTVASSIEYSAPAIDEFPATIPAIQSFDKVAGEQFELTPANQVFSTDEFSKEKTEYLAESMVNKGIIDAYTIQMIATPEEGQGIVVVKKPIAYTLPTPLSGVKYTAEDAYQIDITTDKVVIYSDYSEGIQNGTMTILQATAQRNMLPLGTVKDYTDQKNRGFQIDTARTFFSVDWLKDQMEQMAYYKQNKLQLRLKDSEGIRWESSVVPELMDKEGYYYTQADADELVAYANKFNIEIIPEVDYPGHSEMEVEMLYNEGKTDWYTGSRSPQNRIYPILNIANPEVRQYTIDVYKEAADFFHAKTIHIGGDEYFAISSNAAKNPLYDWADAVLGINNSSEFDAMAMYFNEVAGAMFDKGVNVMVWNDLVGRSKNVELDKRIVVDVWAGGWGSSFRGSTAAAAGYQVMSSSSTNYHNLWYQQRKESVLNPLPAVMYDKFTRFNYSVSSSNYDQDEILSTNMDKSLGQMFPIWSDILGGVSEPVLTRTVFPRYATFSYIVWGAQCDFEKSLTYPELERLMFALGSPREEIKTNAKINYNQNDLDLVIAEVESGLNTKATNKGVQTNIDNLKQKITDIKANYQDYQVDGFYSDIIFEVIHDFENLEFVSAVAVDKSVLEALVNDTTALVEEAYTVESWAVLADALVVAQGVLDNVDATQEEVDATVIELQAAIDQLATVEISVDKSALEALINEASAKVEEAYTVESWAILADALETAQTMLENPDATQEEVDATVIELQTAMDALETIQGEGVNTDKLQQLISEIAILDANEYTRDSWEALSEALAAAKEVLANPKATQAEIDAATIKLQGVKDALVKKIVEVEKPATKPTDKPTDNGGATNTGDTTDTGFLYVLLLLSGVVVVRKYWKRKGQE